VGNHESESAKPPGKKPGRKQSSRPPKPAKLYHSLAQVPPPAERLNRFLREAMADGVRPSEDVNRLVEKFGELWPTDREIEQFVAWVHRGRCQGWYD
jgi:hypothetical protein